jgi:hypothetical protein
MPVAGAYGCCWMLLDVVVGDIMVGWAPKGLAPAVTKISRHLFLGVGPLLEMVSEFDDDMSTSAEVRISQTVERLHLE